MHLSRPQNFSLCKLGPTPLSTSQLHALQSDHEFPPVGPNCRIQEFGRLGRITDLQHQQRADIATMCDWVWVAKCRTYLRMRPSSSTFGWLRGECTTVRSGTDGGNHRATSASCHIIGVRPYSCCRMQCVTRLRPISCTAARMALDGVRSSIIMYVTGVAGGAVSGNHNDLLPWIAGLTSENTSKLHLVWNMDVCCRAVTSLAQNSAIPQGCGVNVETTAMWHPCL